MPASMSILSPPITRTIRRPRHDRCTVFFPPKNLRKQELGHCLIGAMPCIDLWMSFARSALSEFECLRKQFANGCFAKNAGGVRYVNDGTGLGELGNDLSACTARCRSVFSH